MKFYTRFNPPEGSTIDQSEQKSRTVQSESDQCDINKIMERFNRSGKLPSMQTIPAQYGDARVVDFATAQQIVKDAKNQFASLPAQTRKHFGNDPQAFLNALNDQSEDNQKNLLKLGILVERKPTPEEVLSRIAENTKPVEKISTEK